MYMHFMNLLLRVRLQLHHFYTRIRGQWTRFPQKGWVMYTVAWIYGRVNVDRHAIFFQSYFNLILFVLLFWVFGMFRFLLFYNIEEICCIIVIHKATKFVKNFMDSFPLMDQLKVINSQHDFVSTAENGKILVHVQILSFNASTNVCNLHKSSQL